MTTGFFGILETGVETGGGIPNYSRMIPTYSRTIPERFRNFPEQFRNINVDTWISQHLHCMLDKIYHFRQIINTTNVGTTIFPNFLERIPNYFEIFPNLFLIIPKLFKIIPKIYQVWKTSK